MAVPKGVVIAVVLVVVIGAGFFVVRRTADSAASAQVEERSAEVVEMMGQSTPEDYLAFNAGSQDLDSVAHAVANEDDFVSVDARSQRAVVRFQPEGWWQGFTERCIVAVVHEAELVLETPKTACIRIDPADYGS